MRRCKLIVVYKYENKILKVSNFNDVSRGELAISNNKTSDTSHAFYNRSITQTDYYKDFYYIDEIKIEESKIICECIKEKRKL